MNQKSHSLYELQRLDQYYLDPTDSFFHHSLGIVAIFDYVKSVDQHIVYVYSSLYKIDYCSYSIVFVAMYIFSL